ncbi:MAG: hypothetical protein ACPG19_04360 [Saprospiraceae bacterium]
MKYILIFAFLLVGSAVSLNAQQCPELIKAIKTAEKLYDDGSLKESADSLNILTKIRASDCPDNYLKAQVLLTKIHLFLNQDSLADVSFRKVLNTSPMYRPDTEIEPIDLYYFAEKYETVPKWSLAVGLTAGRFDFPFDNNDANGNINGYTTTVDAGDNKGESPLARPKYETATGIGGEVRLGYHPTNWLELAIGAQFERRSFDVQYPLTYNYNSFQSDLLGFNPPILLEAELSQELVQIKENQNWINIPVTVRFNFSIKDFTPVIYLGGEFSYLQNTFITNGEIQRGSVKNDDNISLNDLRVRGQYGLLGGIGFKYRDSKNTKNYLYLNIQYSRYIGAINDIQDWFDYTDGSDKKEVVEELLYKFGYMDSDIRLGYIQASLGYVFTDYKVKKKKVKNF